jgi:hypothetical protein
MKYIDVINNCKLRIDNKFKEFEVTLKNIEVFSELYPNFSSYSFLNEFQLIDITLSFYIPKRQNTDEDGIDISIGLFQIRKEEDGITSYTSNIKYDNDGDLVFDKFLYVISGINTTTGTFILKNIDYVISIRDIESFEKELEQAIDGIFVSFKSNINLIRSKLLELKNSA